MTERGKRNIANMLIVIGLLCISVLSFLHGKRIGLVVLTVGTIALFLGIGIQVSLDLKALKNAKALKGGSKDANRA